MVTDEEENTKAVLANGERVLFAELFERYRAEISPDCKLVLVSFLEDVVTETQILKELRAIGPSLPCQQASDPQLILVGS